MVILLNGSINSGKTTVGKAIASMGFGFAHIEVDNLREFIQWMPLKQSIPINLENAASVAVNFHRHGIHSVITIPLSEDDYEFLCTYFKKQGLVYSAIALFPGIASLKSNRGSRALTAWEINRIDELVVEGCANPKFCTVVDNSAMSVEETARKVLELAGFES